MKQFPQAFTAEYIQLTDQLTAELKNYCAVRGLAVDAFDEENDGCPVLNLRAEEAWYTAADQVWKDRLMIQDRLDDLLAEKGYEPNVLLDIRQATIHSDDMCEDDNDLA